MFYHTYNNQTKSAYHAGLCKNIKLTKLYKKLTKHELHSLTAAGTRMLKKPHVVAKINQLQENENPLKAADFFNSKDAINWYYANIMEQAYNRNSKVHIKYGLEAAKELIKKHEDKSSGVIINIVDPMKGR